MLLLALFTAAPPPRLEPAPVRALIERLGERAWLDRELAESKLRAMGPRILPVLKPALTSKDAETRRRVLRLVEAFQAEYDLQPRRITASFKGAKIEEVLATIQKQTGYGIGLALNEPPRFSATFRDATFWEAVEAVCQQCRLRPTGIPEGVSGVLTVPAKRASRFVALHGAFRAALVRIDESNSLDPDEDDPPASALSLSFHVLAEPRLPVLSIGSVRVDAAYDDRGASMIPPPPPPLNEGEQGVIPVKNAYFQSSGSGVVVSLVRPNRASRSIKLLRGSIPVTVLVGRKQGILLPAIKKGAKFTLDEGACTIVSMRRLPGLVLEAKIQFKFKKPEGDPEPDDRLMRLIQELEFQDHKGRVCHFRIADADDKPDGTEETATLFIQPAGEGRGRTAPMKLAWNKPITRTTGIPFAFRNIPLP